MFLEDYIWFFAAIVFCMILSGIASAKVRGSFAKNNNIRCRSGMTGYDTAVRLMRYGGVSDISVGRVRGHLTDHYHPTKRVVNLSESTYQNSSVAAVAVAAHEIGHVMQKKEGFAFYKVRTALVPVVNFGSFLAMPLVLVGLFMDYLVVSLPENAGFYVAMVGVALYGGSLLFALVTLPVEFNASNRAMRALRNSGLYSRRELAQAREVLTAAALTYVAALITSLANLLRLILILNQKWSLRHSLRRCQVYA